MDRVFESGASASPPSAPASLSTGYPTAGSPTGGIPATKPGPWWYHMVTEELRGTLIAAGLTPDHANLSQLSQAIRILAVPAGAVAYFAMSAAPSGWLKANGAAVSRTVYAALFAAIGTTFGVGDGATTFMLPDLRGEFLRGWDDGRGVDTGRVFGSAQPATSIANHAHSDAATAGAVTPITVFMTGHDGPGPVFDQVNAPYYMSAAGVANGGTPYAGSQYIRSRNVALIACIKY